MKNDFDCAPALYSCYISALIFSQELRRTYIFCIFTVEPSEDLSDQRARYRLKEIYITSVGSRLGWHMHCAITADLVSSQKVTVC